MEDVTGPAYKHVLDVLFRSITRPKCRCYLLHSDPPYIQLRHHRPVEGVERQTVESFSSLPPDVVVAFVIVVSVVVSVVLAIAITTVDVAAAT